MSQRNIALAIVKRLQQITDGMRNAASIFDRTKLRCGVYHALVLGIVGLFHHHGRVPVRCEHLIVNSFRETNQVLLISPPDTPGVAER